MERRKLRRFGDLLAFHGIIRNSRQLRMRNLKQSVMFFQEQQGLEVDGIIGKNTLWALQHAWAEDNQIKIIRCKADTVNGIECYPSFGLRQDAGDQYNKIRAVVKQAGGLVTSSGGRTGLDREPNEYRSPTSHHLWGGAFDLAYESGLEDPETDAFVVVRDKQGGKNYWRVYARVESGRLRELPAVRFGGKNKPDTIVSVRGRFLDFTNLAKRYGFGRIRAKSSYTRQRDRRQLGAEWWHFQYEAALVEGVSQFGIELLRVEEYTEEYIQQQGAASWNERYDIWRRQWF